MDNFPSNDVKQIVVIVLAPEVRHWFEELQVMYNVVRLKIIPVRPNHQIAGAKAKPAPVRKQIANGKLLGHIIVVHLKLGDVLCYLVIPLDLALIDKHRQCGRRKSLAVRRDPEQGILVHLLFCNDRLHAIALR